MAATKSPWRVILNYCTGQPSVPGSWKRTRNKSAGLSSKVLFMDIQEDNGVSPTFAPMWASTAGGVGGILICLRIDELL